MAHHYVKFLKAHKHMSHTFEKGEIAPVKLQVKTDLLKSGVAVECASTDYYDQFSPKTTEDLISKNEKNSN